MVLAAEDTRLMVKNLANDFWQIGILPETGASIAFGRIKCGTQWIDFLRPTPAASQSVASNCASYFLIPWSNRIKDGCFEFQGQSYQLHINSDDGTAIHGVAKNYPWKVDALEQDSISLHFESADYEGVNFPFQFSAQARFWLEGRNFLASITLKNESQEVMPGGFGHHPYFMRSLTDASDTVELEVPCAEQFPLEKALPTGTPLPVTPRVDFQQLRPLGTEFIDDCLTGRRDNAPVRFKYTQSGTEILLYSDDIFQNTVVYVPRGKDFFAVEPVTNANDGFNLYEKGIPGSGVFVLQPGEEKSGTISFELR